MPRPPSKEVDSRYKDNLKSRNNLEEDDYILMCEEQVGCVQFAEPLLPDYVWIIHTKLERIGDCCVTNAT